jgi:hypothetical protein
MTDCLSIYPSLSFYSTLDYQIIYMYNRIIIVCFFSNNRRYLLARLYILVSMLSLSVSFSINNQSQCTVDVFNTTTCQHLLVILLLSDFLFFLFIDFLLAVPLQSYLIIFVISSDHIKIAYLFFFESLSWFLIVKLLFLSIDWTCNLIWELIM